MTSGSNGTTPTCQPESVRVCSSCFEFCTAAAGSFTDTSYWVIPMKISKNVSLSMIWFSLIAGLPFHSWSDGGYLVFNISKTGSSVMSIQFKTPSLGAIVEFPFPESRKTRSYVIVSPRNGKCIDRVVFGRKHCGPLEVSPAKQHPLASHTFLLIPQ